MADIASRVARLEQITLGLLKYRLGYSFGYKTAICPTCAATAGCLTSEREGYRMPAKKHRPGCWQAAAEAFKAEMEVES
jgi:hypothetical protein